MMNITSSLFLIIAQKDAPKRMFRLRVFSEQKYNFVSLIEQGGEGYAEKSRGGHIKGQKSICR